MTQSATPRVYVAGPIHGSGSQARNLGNAIKAARMLRKEGIAPFVPHLWFMWEFVEEMDEANSQDIWLDMDITWLAQCHAMIRLPGKSPGSDKEEAYCKEHGIPVFKQKEEYVGDDMTPVRLCIAAWTSGRWSPIHKSIVEKEEPLTRIIRPELSLKQFQKELAEWLMQQPFGPGQPPHEPLLGIVEEVGELAHAHLKEAQGIRGTSKELQAKGKDAIGDILVYAAGYCITRGWSLQECLELAWGVVKKRNWAQDSSNGRAGEPLPSNYEPTDEGEY